MEPILQVTDLTKTYGGRGSATTALAGVSLAVEKGEFVGVMGASGSGKTTLLNCVSTIDRPTSGSIRVEGFPLEKLKGKQLARFRREKLGFIFQDCNLLDTLTAFENIALALTICGAPAGRIPDRVREMAQLLEIEGCLQKYPYQMSGGQQQRVAAARALVTGPALILADEPTGALDSKSAKLLLERFQYLNQAADATLLMVTHDAFTASYCHRVIFLQDGQVYLELERGTRSRKSFFSDIIRVVTELGGESADVL
ncbi:MAG: ABC transporter ATP-binding protein [Oscillospiraceae bacterium]|nr:ABC transporter ATP-binding protein [Oscillospiraceae bacterium]